MKRKPKRPGKHARDFTAAMVGMAVDSLRKANIKNPKVRKSTALDYYTNPAARMGYGTPSLNEGTEYQMVRLSNNYWLMLTLYRNHWICRRVVDLPAQDMTRAWPKLNCDKEPDDIKEFDRTVARTFTPRRIRQAMKWARLYGGAGCLICLRGHENKLDKPLKLDDINPDTYLGLIPFDRWSGIQPGINIQDDVSNPLEWGLPEMYRVTPQDVSGTSFDVHASRILRFTGPEVPTPEFQAQNYWGISELELIWEELRKRDNASFSILALLFRANILGYKNKELAGLLSGLGGTQTAAKNFAVRMQAINELISNQSMMVMGNEEDEMYSTQYTFAGIGDVYAQFQMDIAGAAHIPVTRLFGRTVTGLGQTNDADERYYEEHIAQCQDDELRPQLDKLFAVIAMSEWGEVPEDLDYTFPSIRVLTEEQKADMADKGAAPIIAAYNSGLTWKKTAVKDLKQLSEVTEIFSNITDEEIDSAEEEPLLPGEAEGIGEPNPDKKEKKLAAGAEV
jgi:phage-related protein (TIGR01555 family)